MEVVSRCDATGCVGVSAAGDDGTALVVAVAILQPPLSLCTSSVVGTVCATEIVDHQIVASKFQMQPSHLHIDA